MVSRGTTSYGAIGLVARGSWPSFHAGVGVTATPPRLRMMRLTPGNLWKNHS